MGLAETIEQFTDRCDDLAVRAATLQKEALTLVFDLGAFVEEIALTTEPSSERDLFIAAVERLKAATVSLSSIKIG